ncbi:MAG TPA: hypothetical protein PKM59_01595 [Thermodesulfobacteriota bacterium]|nr:hypothetical protein [Deltaproteobacteria bacterium]HNR11987.1 hypothetical protein [Thermodesulfobacteriota bacterium]
MAPHNVPPLAYPRRIESPSGLSALINANGSLQRMDHHSVVLNLFLGTEVEGAPAGIYLRRHTAPVEIVPLLGPCSPAVIQTDEHGLTASGDWHGIQFQLSLKLAESASAWFWHVLLKNTGSSTETMNLVYTQDLGLANYWLVRLNEYYVSHYVDHCPLNHPERGFVLASRQNLSMEGRNPWTLIGSLGRGVSFATDALQVHGLATRAGRMPVGLVEGLPGIRRQHEHSMAAIQDVPVVLQPQETAERGFFGWFEEDHPAATSDADLVFVNRALALPEAVPDRSHGKKGGTPPAKTLFSTAPFLEAQELTETEIEHLFGSVRAEEEREAGVLLSFFTDTRRHVVLKAKELTVLRPHGHILRTGSSLTPDEASMTSTVWMNGVFHSMVTQGHVNINRFLSTTHSYLSLLRGNGQRLFVELSDGWRLLDVPSAFEMGTEGCCWYYKHRAELITVRSQALTDRHELTLSVDVLSGSPVRFLLCSHVAINGDDGSAGQPVDYIQDHHGVFVRPIPDSDVGRRFPEGGFRIDAARGTSIQTVGRDELLFSDGISRNQPYLCMITAAADSIGFRLKGCLIPEEKSAAQAPSLLTALSSTFRFLPSTDNSAGEAAARLFEILPWFVHNALIHYLAPRGLEQYSGGGWGTRDVCQGPVEMLLALGRFESVRDLLLTVFKTQNADGDWPQWFMFFDRERNIRPNDSHGDIVFWPLLALAQYLSASQDDTLLEERVPFFHPEGDDKAESAEVWKHVEAALRVISSRLISGTNLAAYGHGDWNDSLQPVQPAMRERLCSSWTVTLHYQTLRALAAALSRFDRCDWAASLKSQAEDIHAEFRRLLIVDGTIAGFAYFQEGGQVDYLLHPRDQITGLSYSLLPMMHAIINDLLTPEQAASHLSLIQAHLLGPDGARLFDQPMQYRGGPQRYFQRAESSAFFGREIGLMYMHAHLRYAEALAHYGDAHGFFRALTLANPIGIQAAAPGAAVRQANCYYSSSDAAFADRYHAFSEYGRMKQGSIPFDGGWRVYSSGAGIAVRLILQCFLGLRREASAFVVDPVIPPSLDGMRAELELANHRFEVIYHIGDDGCGASRVNLNGSELPFIRRVNPYRTGAAEISLATMKKVLTKGVNRLVVEIG